MPVKYKPASYANFSRLVNSPEIQEVLRQIAVKGMAYAESIAPVYEGPARRGVTPGEYKASFSVEVRSHGGVHGDRAEAKIVNDSRQATAVEWVDGYHVLNRTAEALKTL